MATRMEFTIAVRRSFPGMRLITAKRFVDEHYDNLADLAKRDSTTHSEAEYRRKLAFKFARVEEIRTLLDEGQITVENASEQIRALGDL